MSRIRLRSGSGLGDNIYLQPIAFHLKQLGLDLEIPTKHPAIFEQIGITTAPHSKQGIQIVAHYVTRKGEPGTSQFDDMCWLASRSEELQRRKISLVDEGKRSTIDYTFRWSGQREIDGHGKPVLVVARPAKPFDRIDRFGAELSPDWRVFQDVILQLSDRFYVVQVGRDPPIARMAGIAEDITTRSVPDFLDVCIGADALLAGGCGNFVPLSESLRKPCLIVWSHKGLVSNEPFISRITPEKVLHQFDGRPHVRWIVDSWSADRRQEAVSEFALIR